MTVRDEFFWLGEINKATLVINSRQGLLPMPIAEEAAKALREVLADGDADPTKRAKTYITFEPLMLKKADPVITLMHAGRSSQDMHATYRSAILRDHVLEVGDALNAVLETMTDLADKNRETVVPNYTNGVAAQPNSLAHYLLAFLAGFSRDAQKLRQFYVRLDRCPMGSTVLNGTCWPLDREAMCKRLGFEAVAENAYDATQIGQSDLPVEFASILTGICLHINVFLEDLMVQYAQARPWILLQEGGDNTYVSSAMPQKRNPGILNKTRGTASDVVGAMQTSFLRAHNLQLGMYDNKESVLEDCSGVFVKGVEMLQLMEQAFSLLKVNPARSLEELNSDWTTTMALAEALQRQFGIPFRIGHTFASQIVTYARARDLLPDNFPFEAAKEIFGNVTEQLEGKRLPFELTQEEFRTVLSPEHAVHSDVGAGSPLRQMFGED